MEATRIPGGHDIGHDTEVTGDHEVIRAVNTLKCDTQEGGAEAQRRHDH